MSNEKDLWDCDKKVNNKVVLVSDETFELGRKQGALDFADKVIELVRVMPNADGRMEKKLGVPVITTLDGGSIHRFTLIKKLEKLKELEGRE